MASTGVRAAVGALSDQAMRTLVRHSAVAGSNTVVAFARARRQNGPQSGSGAKVTARSSAPRSGNPGSVEQGRDAFGKFVNKNPGELPPGSLAEQATWDAIARKPGWRVIKGRVTVRDATGQVRVYDGVAVSPSGRHIGIDTKSGSAALRAAQRAFDTRLNSTRFNKAVGTGQHEGLIVDRAIEVRQ